MTVQKITKGGDAILPFRLTKNGQAEPLNSPSEITVLLPAQSSSVNSISFTLTGTKVVIDSDARGEFHAEISETDSALLKSADTNQDMTVIIKRGTEDIVRNIKNSVFIEEKSLQTP
jgi:hypothetical protein